METIAIVSDNEALNVNRTDSIIQFSGTIKRKTAQNNHKSQYWFAIVQSPNRDRSAKTNYLNVYSLLPII